MGRSGIMALGNESLGKNCARFFISRIIVLGNDRIKKASPEFELFYALLIIIVDRNYRALAVPPFSNREHFKRFKIFRSLFLNWEPSALLYRLF